MFPKGNLSRIWLVLGALDALKQPTLTNITKATGMPKASVNDVLIKIGDGQVAGVTIEKQGAEYVIVEWFDLRRKVAQRYNENSCMVG